jgi:outer membrane protein assembly factor BamA
MGKGWKFGTPKRVIRYAEASSGSRVMGFEKSEVRSQKLASCLIAVIQQCRAIIVSKVQSLKRNTTTKAAATFFIFHFSFFIIFSSCSRKINYKEDYLLLKQTIEGNKAVITSELDPLLIQKPNKKLLGIPNLTVGLWIYRWREPQYLSLVPKWQQELDTLTTRFEEQNSRLSPTAKEMEKIRRQFNKKNQKYRNKIENGQWVMRTFGDKPAFFNDIDAKRNTVKIKNYLINQGYRNAQVSFRIDSLKDIRKVKINYRIAEGIPYKLRYINLFTIDSPDKQIDSLLTASRSDSFLKEGSLFRASDVMNEYSRIEQLMKNNGFFGFNKQFLRPVEDNKGRKHGGFVINDTLKIPQTDTLFKSIDIMGLQVNYPVKSPQFKKYNFEDVTFRVEKIIDEPTITRQDSTVFQDIKYNFINRYFSPKLLNTKILIRPSTLFKQLDIDETRNQLHSLSQFKLINIDSDTLGKNANVRTLIRVVPNDKYQILYDLGLNVVQASPGPFANATLRVRNVFNHLENFEISGRAALDYQSSFLSTAISLIPTIEYGVNASLIFPRIFLPNKLVKSLNRKNPRTIMSLGYNYLDRQTEFKRSGFRLGMTYNWNKSRYEAFSVSPIDLNVLRTNKTDAFNQRLEDLFNQNGTPLKYAYLDSAFVSSISASYLYNTNVPSQNTKSHYLRLFAESGGTTLNILGEKLVSAVFRGYNPYRFLKFSADFRLYRPIGKKSSVVFRGNTGVIFNYGKTRIAPYEKQFTSGGSNSNRAWAPRRLGLGSGYPKIDEKGVPLFIDFKENQIIEEVKPTAGRVDYGRYNYQFEQLGDIVLETNIELRGNMFHFLADWNYALFIDAGNTWSLRPNEPQEKSTFATNRFYKEIAVGAGVGLRLDFSFFIFRFDVGAKVYDPSRIYTVPGQSQPIDERYLLSHFSWNKESPNSPVFNIGIGYPF